jgi:hypothetical protein
MRSPLLWLALLLHVALATSYAWCTPSFEGPDENSHYDYAWHIANAQQLPLTMQLAKQRGLPQTEGAVLAIHPPLYYAVVAAGIRAFGCDDTVSVPRRNAAFGNGSAPSQYLYWLHEEQPSRLLFWLRTISVLLGAATILCVHRLGRICCPEVPRIGDLAALLTACLPMWSALHGILHNDVLAITLCSAATLLLAELLHADRVKARHGMLLGLLVGLAFLTKLTTLFLGGLCVLTAVILLRRKTTNITVIVTAAITTLAVSGWMFARNYALYQDPLALNAHDQSFPPLPVEARWLYFFGWAPWPETAPSFLPTIFTSLFGRFGWFQLPPHPALICCGAVVASLSGVGLVRALYDRGRKYVPHASWLLLSACVLVFLGTAYFNLSHPQPQARYLFPAIAPATVLLAAGLVRISARIPHRRLAVWLLPMTAIAVFFATFRPAFDPALAPAPVAHRSLVGHIAQDPANPSIEWTSHLSTSPLTAPPTLTWRDPNAPVGTNYTLYAIGDNGRIWLATHEWTKGSLKISGEQFAIPKNIWDFLPRDVPLWLKLRRVPTHANDVPRDLATSDRLRLIRK